MILIDTLNLKLLHILNSGSLRLKLRQPEIKLLHVQTTVYRQCFAGNVTCLIAY